ncbi:MAG: DUF5606 domain-containing protein [Bacteroidales bacterium]|jgi:hypothetical protein|nr:DUF5606 domain-containing protein [Bacteroidales bacterium]
MDLSNIMSIAGKPGLFKLISQTSSGAVVESLLDGKRQNAFSSERISSLKDISIFTTEGDVALVDVFFSIYKKEGGKNCIDHKSDNKILTSYLLELLPNADLERIYPSDMKKLYSWYNLLNEKGLISFEEKEETKEIEPKTEEKKEEN